MGNKSKRRQMMSGNKFEVELTDEEAALIYLFRCLDERGKGGVMNYTTFAYTQLTRNAILQNRLIKVLKEGTEWKKI